VAASVRMRLDNPQAIAPGISGGIKSADQLPKGTWMNLVLPVDVITACGAGKLLACPAGPPQLQRAGVAVGAGCRRNLGIGAVQRRLVALTRRRLSVRREAGEHLFHRLLARGLKPDCERRLRSR
jgi:hypothetical protein